MVENDSTLTALSHRWGQVLGALFLLALVAHASSAADTERRSAEVAAHRARGDALLSEARYGEALPEFVAAYEASTDPALFVLIGQCHRHLRAWDAAMYFYEGYLDARPEAPDRADVERLIAEARAAKAAQEIVGLGGIAPSPPAVEARPIHRRAWFWVTLAAVVAAGAGAVTLGILLAPHSPLPSDSLGTIDGR